MTKIEETKKRKINLRKYFLVFLITLTIFLIGFYIANQFNKKRIVDVKEVENTMSTDILSSEIQFSLLEEASCKGINEKTTLSQELKDLAKKLSYMEKKLGSENKEVEALKKKYTLLQIKDILLMKKISKKCKLKPINILYFYSNDKNDDDCKKEGYVLTRLSQDNPRLRVYTFDYDLDLGTLKTLMVIKKVKGDKLPVLVINNKTYYGFQSLEKIKKLLPKLKLIQKKFLELPDAEKSKVEIQCAEDKQCEINKKLETKCGLPVAINKENSEENILEFNKKLEEYQKENDTNCNILTEYTDEVYCSKDNLCKVKEKNN